MLAKYSLTSCRCSSSASVKPAPTRIIAEAHRTSVIPSAKRKGGRILQKGKQTSTQSTGVETFDNASLKERDAAVQNGEFKKSHTLSEPAKDVASPSKGHPTARRAQIWAKMLALRNGIEGHSTPQEIVLDADLSPSERRTAHVLAERLGLAHISVGSKQERRFTARRRTVEERLAVLKELVDAEEVAVRAEGVAAQAGQSWRNLVAQGLLLHRASVVEREPVAFGRERWVLADGVGNELAGHVARFGQRARPGAAVRLAEQCAGGSWAAAAGAPPGRVAWVRSGRLCVVFDAAPEELGDSSGRFGDVADLLLVPDGVAFDRMRSGIAECGRGKGSAKALLECLLGTGLALRTGSEAEPPLPDGANGRSKPANGSSSQGGIPFFDHRLNEEQREAVAVLTGTRASEARSPSPVALLHGPFGTGKTRTLVEVVRQRVARGERVLVCAASNAAVDNMATAVLAADPAMRLARAGLAERVGPSLALHTLDALREAMPQSTLAAEMRKDAHAASAAATKWTRASDGGERRRAARREAGELFREARRLESAAAFEVLRRCRVLCGTLTGFASALQDVGGGNGDRDAMNDVTRFDCIVVDEASQAVTPALLLTLPYLRNNREDAFGPPVVVLAGDHRQLPPTVIAEQSVGGREGGGGGGGGGGAGLAVTLFEELMLRDSGGVETMFDYEAADAREKEEQRCQIIATAEKIVSVHAEEDNALQHSSRRGGEISASLCVQYRMPPELMAFPSAAFYGGILVAHQPSVFTTTAAATEGTTHDEEALHSSTLRSWCPCEVIDTAGAGFDEQRNAVNSNSAAPLKSTSPSSSSSSSSPRTSNRAQLAAAAESLSCSNPGQAALTARIVRDLSRPRGGAGGYLLSDIGVITPYSAQVMLLRGLLEDEVANGLEVDSVDGFQGREKRAIVVDCVRSNAEGSVGFLADYRRLNVALTRAREKLVVVGDSSTLAADPLWSTFFDWATACGSTVPESLGHSLTWPRVSECIAYRSVFELPSEGGW